MIPETNSNYNPRLVMRQRIGRAWQIAFMSSTVLALVFLIVLMLNIVNSAFGLVALENTIPPSELADEPLESLEKEALVAILADNIRTNAGRKLEREQRFFADGLAFEAQDKWDEVCARAEPPEGCLNDPRDHANVLALVYERVVEQQVLETYPLWDSITRADEIRAEVAVKHPDATVEFWSWLDRQFITTPMSSDAALAGVRTAIIGSIWVIALTILFAFPTGVGAALYLQEYAPDNWLTRIIQTNIDNLAGVPSILYGMLGLAIFARALEYFTSGQFIGVGSENGRTILSAALTMSLLILPVIIINAQEALRAVPSSLRSAAYGVGATRWQMIWSHVLPYAMPGILTGTILAVSRAIGETAPLLVVGAATFMTNDPSSIFSKFTVMPIQIFNWTSRPQAEFRNIAAAAIIVLLFILLTLNTTAILLRNRFSTRR